MSPGGPPVVGIICDFAARDGMPSHCAGNEYVAAVQGTGALPLLIPVTQPPLEPEALLARLDGLLFTGATSNVAPARYAGAPDGRMQLDEARDATSLPLLRAAIAAGIPTLCICRGFQELNVALGGTLDPRVQETPGRRDHRAEEKAPLAVQYGHAHAVTITPGGILAGMLGTAEVMVNSLHQQGIARLAPGLLVEARAPDGLIEAVSLPGAKAFLLGVQWHPEWAATDPVSRVLIRRIRAGAPGREVIRSA